MALNKITALQTQIQSSSTSKVPVITSTPVINTEIVRVGNIKPIENTITVRKTKVSDTFFASKLLNYVEPIDILGNTKTVFYTELATNFKKGDKVFILNGSYDSADFIDKDKYTQSTDGYRVIGVDGCRIILDIDFTGKLPFNDFKFEDLFFVHHITTQEQFDLVNSMKIAIAQSDIRSNIYSVFESKSFRNRGMQLYGRNIIYVGKSFIKSSNPLNFSQNAPSYSGFWAKNGDTWVDVTNAFRSGAFFDYNKDTNPYGLVQGERIMILGEDFTFDNYPINNSSFTFRERQVYKFDTTKQLPLVGLYGVWAFDKEYKQPMISKLNFRYGKFSGTHNDGIYGSYDKVVKWNNSNWNSGILVNAAWKSGVMNNKSTTTKSFSAKLTTVKSVKIPAQNVDLTNNKGFGYNYVMDSTLEKATIVKGNFENSNLGLTSSENVINAYYNGQDVYSVKIDSANLTFCNIYNSYISNSSLAENIVENTNLLNAKLLNNQLLDCLVNQSQYSSNGGIQIIGSDLWSYSYGDVEDFTTIVGTLKLYISDKDFLKLEKSDSFYIDRVNKDLFLTNLSNDLRIQLPIETKYLVGFYDDYEISGVPGRKVQMMVSLKPKISNYRAYQVYETPESTDTVFYQPNVDSVAPSGLNYWTRIDEFYGEWGAGGRDEYQVGEYVQYEDKFYVWSGLTTSNNVPEPTPIVTDYSWTLLQNVLFWNELQTYDPEEYVLAYTVDTGSYSFFKANEYNYDINTGEVFTDTISSVDTTITTLKKTLQSYPNGFRYSSIDIESPIFGNYIDKNNVKRYVDGSPLSSVPIELIDNIFTNNYIKLSDFRSGLFLNSTWQSGNNIGYFGNIIRKLSNNLSISFSGTNLLITILNRPYIKTKVVKGFDIVKDDSVWISGISYITPFGSEISLTGRYTVLTDPVRSLVSTQFSFTVKPNFAIPLPIAGGFFRVMGADGNTYASISKFSIENSVVTSGLFKRTNFQNCLITNDLFDNKDVRFLPSNTSLLRLINIIFKGNNLTVNDGVIYRSHFVDGIFNLGIVHNSYWNGNTFSNGIFSAGAWISGNFLSGKFIDSNSVVASTDYHHDQLFYKNWNTGLFETGEFVNSVWLDGIFENGKFYNSHFYGGTWNNGILGSKSLKMMSTSFGYYKKLPNIGATVSLWNYGVVENAIVGGNGVVYWYNGKCNSGEFTSYGSTPDNESIWYDGEFNGSKFTHLARWKKGVFNSGKFWSYYGWEMATPNSYSNLKTDYAWEDGRFNSGEFGYKGLTSNSTWFDGRFLGGDFAGRLWRGGHFVSGNFFGSGPTQSIISNTSSIGEFNIADSYTYSFYGVWASGFVIDNEKNITSLNDCQVNRVRVVNSKYLSKNRTSFNNMLWLSGTFSHDNAVINNSLWLSGIFERGQFNGGIFNPYVDRDFTGSFSNSSFGSNAIWLNGVFVTGSMWNSEWYNGKFRNGYMSGVRWNNGTFDYGTAENIYWVDGTWKNGNWNGSPFKYNILTFTVSNETGDTLDVNYLPEGREKDVIMKVASYLSPTGATEASLHLMNIFSASNTTLLANITNDKSQVAFVGPYNNWTYSLDTYKGEYYDESLDLVNNEILTKSEWVWESSFQVVVTVASASYSEPVIKTTDENLFDELSNRSSGLYLRNSGVVDQPPDSGGIDSPSVELPGNQIVRGGGETIIISPNIKYNTIDTVKPDLIKLSYDGSMVTYGGTNSYVADFQGWIGYNVYTEGDTPPSSKLFATVGSSKNIFSQNSTTYTIELIVAVELVPTVEVEIFVGGLSSSVFELESDGYVWNEIDKFSQIKTDYYSYYARIYKLTLAYNTSPELLSRPGGSEFSIRKNSNGILRILNAVIKQRAVQYHPVYHNALYKAIDLVGGTVSFPATSSVALTAVTSNGFEIGINFGNGVFRSGTWENGVWNNGYRSSQWTSRKDIIKASDVLKSKTYKSRGINTWYITIKCLEDFSDGKGGFLIDPNKKVMIGNIISIDINNKRSYIRDPLRVIRLDSLNKEITVEFTSNFEIRDIRKDSTTHLIYITQNIWQNGVFLNGYFNGVWGNGVFKGFPRTTEMVDSHWITGYFEGGHFKSREVLENKNNRLPSYNTGLVQSITFKDRNVASPTFSSYESWMDVNYFTYSNVNLNIYSRNIGVSFKTNKVIESYNTNLYGQPTTDILTSESYFRNSKTTAINRYTLGTKFQVSNDLLKGIGSFDVPYSSFENYTVPNASELDKINKAIKKSDFLDKGWTYSIFTLSDLLIGALANLNYGKSIAYSITSNTNKFNRSKLNFGINFFKNWINLDTGVDTGSGGNREADGVFFTLNNTRAVTKPNRYYMIELNMASLPATQSAIVMSDSGEFDSEVYVHNPSQSSYPLSFTEYFYNVPNLSILFYYSGGGGKTFSIDSISFQERDQIPFFKYYKSNDQIDQSIKNPYSGLAPIIDYRDQNFNFIGNVELGIDYRVIVKQNASVTRIGSSVRLDRYQLVEASIDSGDEIV